MEKERKVYEAPAMRVHTVMAATKPLCESGGSGSGSGDVIQGPSDSRRFWLEDEDEE